MIRITDISHSFDDKQLFNGMNFVLNNGVHAIVGESGSGKTTVLRAIAGLLTPTAGKVEADKPIAVSFQENRLFPWYSALKNVAIVSDQESAEIILTELGLGDSLTKKPSELSGGMKKRVSLARALIANSKTVLLDEPFAGLDEATAMRTLEVIKKYSVGKTVLISTHNLSIANSLDTVIEI